MFSLDETIQGRRSRSWFSTASTVGSALESVIGTNAILDVFVVAGETQHGVTAQTLTSATAKGLGYQATIVATIASNLATFVIFRDAAAALVGDTRRATCRPTDTETFAFFDAEKDRVVTIKTGMSTAKADKHAVITVATRHDGMEQKIER